MTDQVFELENFRGPLDLLLHLIREQELEITEVDLARVCDQYLAAIELMRAIDINVAGEFLVMASTLMLIKSRSLLPREEEVDLEEELDPADELIQQLLEYRKYKTLSLELGRCAEERALRTGRGLRETPPDPEAELAEIGLWDLVGTFVRLMEELGLQREFHTLEQQKPLRAYLREVLDRLASRSEPWTLRELVGQGGDADGVFGVFLSLLELVKTRQVTVVQEHLSDEIRVALREDRDPSRLGGLLDVDEPEAGSDAPVAAERDAGPHAEPEAPSAASSGDASSARYSSPSPSGAPPVPGGLAPSDGDSIVSPFPPAAGDAAGG